MYTFTEQCEEILGLHLDDGTKKIFLNMSSKNGSKELVSLLQYIKNTTLDNLEIQVFDERILELDKIVTEVKESEEWEEVEMSIWDIAMEKGVEVGIQQGSDIRLVELVCKKLAKGCSVVEIADILEEDEKLIQRVINVAGKYAPQYDINQIYKDLCSENKKE